MDTSSKNSSNLSLLHYFINTQHAVILTRASNKCSNNVIKPQKTISPRLSPEKVKTKCPMKGTGHGKRGKYMHTKKTFAELLQISESTVNRLIDNGEITPLRIGRSVRITESEVARFILRNEVQK